QRHAEGGRGGAAGLEPRNARHRLPGDRHGAREPRRAATRRRRGARRRDRHQPRRAHDRAGRGGRVEAADRARPLRAAAGRTRLEMPVERLHLMTVGYEFVPKAWVFEGETDESPVRLPLTSLLARTEGRWFLFDTGLGPEFRDVEFSRRWYQWGDPELPGDDPDPLLDQLRRCGVSVDEIDALVMSHFHLDHT